MLGAVGGGGGSTVSIIPWWGRGRRTGLLHNDWNHFGILSGKKSNAS